MLSDANTLPLTCELYHVPWQIHVFLYSIWEVSNLHNLVNAYSFYRTEIY